MHLKMHWEDKRQHCLRLRTLTQMIWKWNRTTFRVVAVGHVIEHDKSLDERADFPDSCQVDRQAAGPPWFITRPDSALFGGGADMP